ncbi:hypothetical protein Tsp_04876, partial [Trichinella spiralis]
MSSGMPLKYTRDRSYVTLIGRSLRYFIGPSSRCLIGFPCLI